MNMNDFFLQGYLDAAFWTEAEDLEFFTIEDLSAETLEKARQECEAFTSQNAENLAKFEDLTDRDAAHQGHDFWLTRCRHGTGFWDRGAGEVGEALTKAANAAGERWIYVGDDDKVYITG